MKLLQITLPTQTRLTFNRGYNASFKFKFKRKTPSHYDHIFNKQVVCIAYNHYGFFLVEMIMIINKNYTLRI